MGKQATKKQVDAFEARNNDIRAEHAKMRKQILAMHPEWNPAELEKVTFTWGEGGLRDIIVTCEQMAKLQARFAK